MSEQSLYRRIARRETHQSRSTASVVVLTLVALAAVYAGIEIVLALLGAGPLLVTPSVAVIAFGTSAAWLRWAGAGAVVFGVILILIALIPSRRARHRVSNERMAIVLDDGVLAGALAAEARGAVGVAKNRVRATVSRRTGQVTLTPASGFPISREDAQNATDRLLATLDTSPAVRARVSISSHGTVGS